MGGIAFVLMLVVLAAGTGVGTARAAQAETLDDVFASREFQLVASGFKGGFTEGPLWHPDGYLLFTDFNDNKIYKLIPGPDARPEVFRDKSGATNGITLNRENRLIACEMWARRVTRTKADGTIEVVTDKFEGIPYNSPNDVVVDARGRIYFTDADWYLGNRKPNMGGVMGVYRVDLDGTVTRLLQQHAKPNGIAFAPNGKRLFVAYDMSAKVMVYDVAEDGSVSNERQFGPPVGLPDGIKVDTAGRLFISSNEGIVVFAADGAKIGTLPVPNKKPDGQPDPLAANCCFGGAGYRTLFVTARGSVYQIGVKTPGIGAGVAAAAKK